jgi:hypothetical protein
MAFARDHNAVHRQSEIGRQILQVVFSDNGPSEPPKDAYNPHQIARVIKPTPNKNERAMAEQLTGVANIKAIDNHEGNKNAPHHRRRCGRQSRDLSRHQILAARCRPYGVELNATTPLRSLAVSRQLKGAGMKSDLIM